MYDTYITVVGNLVDDPSLRTTPNGHAVASFRIGSTARRRDAEGSFVDANKFFVSVTCWREMAENAAASLHRGDPVVVQGRISTRDYVKDEQTRVSYEMEADAIGHNLARGRSSFAKRAKPRAVTSVAVDEQGLPPDLTTERLEAEWGREREGSLA